MITGSSTEKHLQNLDHVFPRFEGAGLLAKEVRSIVGLVNYYAKFCPHVAHSLKYLYQLLKEDVSFYWTKKQQQAFEEAEITHVFLIKVSVRYSRFFFSRVSKKYENN